MYGLLQLLRSSVITHPSSVTGDDQALGPIVGGTVAAVAVVVIVVLVVVIVKRQRRKEPAATRQLENRTENGMVCVCVCVCVCV